MDGGSILQAIAQATGDGLPMIVNSKVITPRVEPPSGQHDVDFGDESVLRASAVNPVNDDGLTIGQDAAKKVGLYGSAVVQAEAMTAQLTALTHEAPGTPDYAIAAGTQTTPFGFTTADEMHTVLSVIANLQARVAELEAALVASTGIGVFADPA